MWLKHQRDSAIRLEHALASLLSAIGLGLAAITLRPRRPDLRLRRLGAGHVAAVATGLVVLACVARVGVDLASGNQLTSHMQTTVLSQFVDTYQMWYWAIPMFTWSLLGAWGYLAASGRWRRPIDWADRLGMALGAGWLATFALQGVIYVLAWS